MNRGDGVENRHFHSPRLNVKRRRFRLRSDVTRMRQLTAMVEEALVIVGENQIAEAGEKVAIAAQPWNVAGIERHLHFERLGAGLCVGRRRGIPAGVMNKRAAARFTTIRQPLGDLFDS
jgi:hypothetical protein